MSDTPRMKAAQMTAMEHGTGDVWRVGCDLERELNAANVEIKRLTAKVAQLYEGADEQKQRIKRLEEAGNELHDGWRGNRNNMDKYLKAWRKAKEAKL